LENEKKTNGPQKLLDLKPVIKKEPIVLTFDDFCAIEFGL